MHQTLPQGTDIPLDTPFTERGTIDFKCPDNFIHRLLESNIEAMVMLLTTGGSPTMNPKEYEALIKPTRTRDQGTERQKHSSIASPVTGCGIGSNPTPIKTALAMMSEMKKIFCPPLGETTPYNRSH